MLLAIGWAAIGVRGSIVSAGPLDTASPSRPATANTIRYAVVGDFGDNSVNEQNVVNLIDSWNPAFVLTVGDNSYGSAPPIPPAVSTIDLNIGKYYSDYIGAYNGGYGAGSPINRFFPSIGNHDYSDGGGINAYLDYFTLPGAAITGTYTSGNERYYDFVQGPIHFFALNSDGNEPHGTTSTSMQGQWLQTQLAAATEPWKIVYFHHAPYSSSSFHGNSAWMQWPFQQWGADAVLSGHDHTYERVVLNGFPYFVNGAGGHSLYSFGTPIAGSVVRYSDDYGALLVEATAVTMTFKFYSIAGGGTLIDSHTITAQSIDLSSSAKLASASIVSSTGRLTYTIVLTNSGSMTATNITLTDTIPLSTTYVNGSTSGGASYNAGQNRIEWSGSLSAGDSITLYYAVDVDLPGFGLITNRAYVSIDNALDRILSVSTQVTPSGLPWHMMYLPLIIRQP